MQITAPSSAARPQRTALVTGASSGIGRDLSVVLARNGFNLVLVARSRAALDEVASDCTSRFSIATRVLVQDLADPASPQRIFDDVQSAGIAIDVLVNNAGFGIYGRFAESDLKMELSLIQVNISALVALSRLFVGRMIERGWGRILNVASTAAFVPGPYMTDYYASKAFVISHSVALARELKRTGVKVTALCPGPTRTQFNQRAGMQKARLFRVGVMESMPVAEAGFDAMMKGKTVIIPGFANKLMALGAKLGPRRLAARVAAKLNQPE